MDDTRDLTVEILKQIRDGVLQTNARLDRVIQEQIRHATAIVSLEAGQRELVTAVVSLDRRQDQIVSELRLINARIDRVLTGDRSHPVC